MLIINAATRERLIEICGEELGRLVSDRITVEIDEAPHIAVEGGTVRIGIWIRVLGPINGTYTAPPPPDSGAAREWQGEPVDPALFERAMPCYICGRAELPGYFNAAVHPCAAGYHLAVEKIGRVDQA